MIRILAFYFLLGTHAALWGCDKNTEPAAISLFDSVPVVKPVTPLIAETSGMADSKKNKGFLWAHEDSGNPPALYLLGHDGKVAKSINLAGITNRDWEEMQRSGDQIYLGEIGDNGAKHSECRFYIFDEPHATDESVTDIQTLRFVYEDGPRDAEAFLVDNISKDIFIITKSDNPSKIYQLTFPYSFTSINTARAAGNLSFSGIVGAAQSENGTELILKSYTSLHYYSRKPGESILDALKKQPQKIPYRMEPQGEAVTFALDGSGYFTLSEKGFFNNVSLYFYKRN